MSTVSASSYDLSSNPMKRKRGRPRKEVVSGSESNRRVLGSPSSNESLVGQEVSGFFVGAFDAGFLLTVQVGSSGPIMNGLVFDPRLSVPISAENDVAPHLPMLKRNDSSPPIVEDFFNRSVSSPDDISQKNLMESYIPQAARNAAGPSKTLRIFLEGAAAESSQLKNEEASTAAGLSDISKPSNGYSPSVVSISTSSEASKIVSADIPKATAPVIVARTADTSEATRRASTEPLNIPKAAVCTSAEGLPYKIAPCVVKSLEASSTSKKVNLDETFCKEDSEARQVLEL